MGYRRIGAQSVFIVTVCAIFHMIRCVHSLAYVVILAPSLTDVNPTFQMQTFETSTLVLGTTLHGLEQLLLLGTKTDTSRLEPAYWTFLVCPWLRNASLSSSSTRQLYSIHHFYRNFIYITPWAMSAKEGNLGVGKSSPQQHDTVQRHPEGSLQPMIPARTPQRKAMSILQLKKLA